MATFFISDLHLDSDHPELTAIFLRFLKEQAPSADALYILGDFFSVWLGDDVKTIFSEMIINALRALTQTGVPVYFMHGNRDFLLGQRFFLRSGCRSLPDPSLIDLYGTPTLLMHGDTLCWQDTAYLRLRRVVRNPVIQRLFLSLPLRIRQVIARRLRAQSTRAPVQTLMQSDAVRVAILQVVQEHSVSQLIHGHTHRPAIEFNFVSPVFKRIVLSDWVNQGSALLCTPDGALRLIYFS